MKGNPRNMVMVAAAFVAAFLAFSSFSPASAEEYVAMKGVNAARVIFDMRDGIPEIAALHMKLIHDTYDQLVTMKKEPIFVVVFMGSAVKLISSNQTGFSGDEKSYLEEINDTISRMSRAGIRLEVCLAAVDYFKIDPTTIQPEIKQVRNGWISEIGYQANGYSLVPVY